MTVNQEEHLRWKSRQVGGDDLKEVFALVDELRAKNLCTWARMGDGLEDIKCSFQKGHEGLHSYQVNAQ